jgi:Tfp pilus assembly protein PilN
MKSIDFLPERIRFQRDRRRRLVRQGCLLGLCLIGLAVLGYVRHGRIQTARAELAMLNDRSANSQRQLALRRELESQQADLMIKKRIADQLGSRASALEVLAEVSRLLPGSIVLSSLTVETMEIDAPLPSAKDSTNETDRASAAAAPSGKAKTRSVKRLQLTLTGLSPTDVEVANFIGQLSTSPLFENVNMGYAKNTVFRNRPAREFQVSCHVVR